MSTGANLTQETSRVPWSNSTLNIGATTLDAITPGSNSSTNPESVLLEKMPWLSVNQNFNQSFAEASILGGKNEHNSSGSVIMIVLVSSALVCLILTTVIGNLFVISAILLERSLRIVGNYLVLSLAVTDLLVACLVMPIGALYEVTQEWNLGPNLCEIWTFFDVLCCTASIFHLLAIACDRFWAVTTIDYIHRRKGKHVCMGICFIWIFSATISLGPMLGWKDDDFENRIIHQKLCLVSQALSYQVFATIFSFYAPCILILLLYYRIYQVAKTRLLLKKQRYKYRIRRRPSFYRPRKSMESEIIRELPSVGLTTSSGHRSSFNPADDYFSSSAIPGTSSSGVYSSTSTDCPTTITSTIAPDGSPNSLSPLAIVMKDPPAMPSDIDASSKKRLSLAQFLAFQQQKQSDMCERYVLGSGTPTDESIRADIERRISRGHNHGETSIIVTMPQSNIVVYVDDFASFEGPTDSSGKECTEDDEEDDEEEDGGAISFDDRTAFTVDDLPQEEEDEEIETEEPTSMNVLEKSVQPADCHSNRAGSEALGNGNSSRRPSCQATIIINPRGSIAHALATEVQSEHRRPSAVRKASQRNTCKRKGKGKRLQFRNKITRYDSTDNKQESKAAKILSIITLSVIFCWLPFFILALLMPLCRECVINKYLFDFCLWLGWTNSSINPLLYTAFSPDFRNAFKKLLFGNKRAKR